MNDWHTLCITDKSGKECFKTTASPMAVMSEIRNLKRHIELAKQHPQHYQFLDVASAVVMLDGAPYREPSELDDDDLLKELGL